MQGRAIIKDGPALHTDRDRGKEQVAFLPALAQRTGPPRQLPVFWWREAGAGMHMWLMKNSVKIVKLFLFLPLRKVHCFTETMGKEEGKKERDRTVKSHTTEVA